MKNKFCYIPLKKILVSFSCNVVKTFINSIYPHYYYFAK